MKKSIAKKIILGFVVSGAFATTIVNATEYSLSNTSRANYFMNSVEEETLAKRLGELRRESGENGIWIKSFYSKGQGDSWGKYTFWGESGNLVEGFDQSVHGFQVGYDRKVSSNEKHNIYLGGFIGLTKSDVNYNFRPYGALQGIDFSVEEDMKGYNFGVYGIYHQPKNDFYVNGTLKFGSVKNEIAGTLKIPGQNNSTFEDNDRRSNWGATVEVGQKFFLQKKKAVFM